MSFLITLFFSILIYLISGTVFSRILLELSKRAIRLKGEEYKAPEDHDVLIGVVIWPLVAFVIIFAGIGRAIMWVARPK